MRDLRLVAVTEDGTALVLSDDSGTEHRLPLDDALRATVRQDRTHHGHPQTGTDTQLRPRDIQARIRAGETAEDVAAAAGMPIEKIRRYEGPVLAEREHVARQAQTATVRRTGNAEGPAPRLGELISSRLEPAGIDVGTLSWDAWRRDDNRWTLRLAYPSRGRQRAALWVYDPQRRVVLPQDGDAHAFVDGTDPEQQERPADSRGEDPPRLRRLTSVPNEKAAASRRTDAPGGTQAHEAERHAAGSDRLQRPDEAAEAVEAAEGVEADTVAEADADAAAEDLGTMPEPVSARLHGAQAPSDAVPLPLPLPLDAEPAPVAQAEPGASAGSDEPPADADTPRHASPTRRKPKGARRASVPSWDDIVFGTRKSD